MSKTTAILAKVAETLSPADRRILKASLSGVGGKRASNPHYYTDFGDNLLLARDFTVIHPESLKEDIWFLGKEAERMAKHLEAFGVEALPSGKPFIKANGNSVRLAMSILIPSFTPNIGNFLKGFDLPYRA